MTSSCWASVEPDPLSAEALLTLQAAALSDMYTEGYQIMKKTLVLIVAIILLFNAPSVSGKASYSIEDKALSLLAINVRKADALLLRCGDTAYLIDTGTEESYEQMVRVLRDEGITRLTGVIITHTDKDHAGGLMDLMGSDIFARTDKLLYQ